jgi:CRISPR/Cas system-associated endonuclease Cas1
MKGYGVSINLKENRICLKVARIHSQASKKLKNGMFLKYRMKIVIFGKGCLSTEAIKPLTDHNIDIILTDTHIFLDQIF